MSHMYNIAPRRLILTKSFDYFDYSRIISRFLGYLKNMLVVNPCLPAIKTM